MAKTNTIITIDREYGSGGREIGVKLSEALEVPLYDRDMLNRAAKDSGIAQELIQSNDERSTGSFLFSLVMDSKSNGVYSDEMPLNQKVFMAQYDTIRSIADEGPCVLVGRCADCALADRDDVLNVFIHADIEQRIRRVAVDNDLTDAKAKELIQRNDKERASYYNFYSNKKWGDARTYHACFDSSKLGINGVVEEILNMVKIRESTEKVELWKE